MCKLGTLIEQGCDGILVPVALKPIVPLSKRPRIVFMMVSASISNNCRRDPGRLSLTNGEIFDALYDERAAGSALGH
jgi:hypothetical protein